MDQIPISDPGLGLGRNYYADQLDKADGLRYRLDGRDVVKQVMGELRGGSYQDEEGKTKYREEYRLMNELGVSRAESLLQGVVNKITHLTNYENEYRISLQIKGLARAWIFELVRNTKRWALRDKYLVARIVENAMYSSMLRGNAALEAVITGKQMSVIESHQTLEQPRQGFLSGLFGGKRRGEGPQ